MSLLVKMQIQRLLLWKSDWIDQGWGPISVFFCTSTTVENVYLRKAGRSWPLQLTQWKHWPRPCYLEVNCWLSPTPRPGFGGVAEREWCRKEHNPSLALMKHCVWIRGLSDLSMALLVMCYLENDSTCDQQSLYCSRKAYRVVVNCEEWKSTS